MGDKWETFSVRANVSPLQNILNFLKISEFYLSTSLFTVDNKKLQNFFNELVTSAVAKRRETEINADEEIEEYEFSFEDLSDEYLDLVGNMGLYSGIIVLVENVKRKVTELRNELKHEEDTNLSLLQV